MPLQSCCDMRDQSGKCILQHVSQSIGTECDALCGNRGGGGGLWRQAEEMEEASGDEGACARAPRACEDGKRWWPLAGMIHSETNEHVNKSSTRALEFLPLYRSVGASPLFSPSFL